MTCIGWRQWRLGVVVTLELILVLILLAGAIGLFAIGRPRADAVGLMMMAALPLTGVVSAREAVAAFGNPTIVLIAAMFVIGEGLARTGVARRLGDWLVARGGKHQGRLLALLMLIVGALGSVMYSAGVIAIFIPVALRIAHQARMTPGQVLMPVSYAALISGMLTLVAAAPNLIVNDELTRAGVAGLGFLSLTPIGLTVLLLGTPYMMVARRWLRPTGTGEGQEVARPQLVDWVQRYALAERELRARVAPGSRATGQSLAQLGLTQAQGWRVIALERSRARGGCLIGPDAQTELAEGDILLLDGARPSGDTASLCTDLGLDPLPLSGLYFADRAQAIGMAEAVLPADSRLVGQTLDSSAIALTQGLTAVGLRRGRAVIDAAQRAATVLRAGDTLLLAGGWPAIERLRDQGRDLVITELPRELDEVLPAARQAPYAVLALAVTVGLIVSNLLPAVQAALIGCLLMGVFRCIDLDSAYRAIGLRTLVLIAGMLPFGVALERTGGIDLAADALVGLLGNASPHLILAALFLITLGLGLFVVAAANAVLMAPLAMALAAAIGASPYPFAIVVALAASSAFMTPVAPPNAMVATLGGYRFADYARIGFPLALMAMACSVTLVPWLYPLY
jgi:di/tricarboxylate transporter